MPGAGSFSHVGIAKEVTWGTAVAASDYIPFVSEGINEEIEQIMSEALKGIFDEAPTFEGMRNIAGDLAFDVHPNILGYFLRSAFGQVTTTQPDAVGAPTVYQHVFTPIQSFFSSTCALPPYTLEVHRDMEQAFQYAGAVVNDLSLAFGNEQKIMRGSANIIAKTLALIAKSTPSFDTTNAFLWNQATITINAAANNDLQSVSVGINNNLEGKSTLNGTKNISQIRRSGKRTYPINLTFAITDLTEYNRFRSQSEVAAKIELIGDIISGTQKYKLTIDIPKFKYTSFPINVGGAEDIVVNAAGVAKYDPAAAHAMKVTLINTKQSY